MRLTAQRTKTLLKALGIGSTLSLIAGLVFIITWFYLYRFDWLITFKSTPWMQPASIEGYTDKLHYYKGDTATFYIRSAFSSGNGILRKVTGPYAYDTLNQYFFGKIQQPIGKDPAVSGAGWDQTFRLPITDSFSPGIYSLHLSNKKDTTNITFTIGQRQSKPEVAILLPVTTWVAYNQWGSKSLYVNGMDSSKVYHVSTQRPMTSLNYGRKRERHSVHVQANILNWFQKRYQTTVLPDYSLETMPQSLRKADVIVLAYHCEYFSKAMYNNLEAQVYDNNTSLISLGGNQVYWKVRWNRNYSRLTCRKDLTFFDNSWSYGGLWRHHLRPEARLLGVQYTPAGIGTYAPYQVKAPEHWLFKGTGVDKGDRFGRQGINDYPICGDETDKTTWFTPSGTVTLAKGLNPQSAPELATFNDQPEWNGKGGGSMVFRSLNEQTGILSTGSIHSGSGLGKDSVFTAVIDQFMERYH